MSVSIQKLFVILTFFMAFISIWAMRDNHPSKAETIYPEHLTGAFTGGFGEETCHSCHFDYDLNWEEGSLLISGIPDKIQPGKTYEFEVSVSRENLGKAGFQLTSRFRNGNQAGRFNISGNKRLMFTKEAPDSIQYVQHSETGTDTVEEGRNQWFIKWEAPSALADSIQFNISANAANGDQSEFGDWIYVKDYVRGFKLHQ